MKGCPRRPPHAVAASFVLGALTHILWDGVTHSHAVMPDGPINWAQHASTLLGSVALAYWLSRKLRAVAPCLPDEVTLSPTARRWAWSLLLSASVVSVAASIADWPSISLELATLKQIARSASAAALQGLALATALYCAAWKLRSITS